MAVTRLRTAVDAAIQIDLKYVDALLAAETDRSAVRDGAAALLRLNLLAERHHLTALVQVVVREARSLDIKTGYEATALDPTQAVNFDDLITASQNKSGSDRIKLLRDQLGTNLYARRESP